jgi:hypothetical protein
MHLLVLHPAFEAIFNSLKGGPVGASTSANSPPLPFRPKQAPIATLCGGSEIFKNAGEFYQVIRWKLGNLSKY